MWSDQEPPEESGPAQKNHHGRKGSSYTPPGRRGKRCVSIWLDDDLLQRFKAVALDISNARKAEGLKKVGFQDLIVELLAAAAPVDNSHSDAKQIAHEIAEFVQVNHLARASIDEARVKLGRMLLTKLQK
jgi:hypothetical protein